MAIQLFGWTVNDIAAIIAVIASPLIFWAGYRRTRRTEEIKTVTDLTNKIEQASTEIPVFREEQPFPKDSTDGSKNQWLLRYKRRLGECQLNISYLTMLVKNKDIKAKYLVDFCRSTATQYLKQLNEHYIWFEREFPEFSKKELDPFAHQEVAYLEKIWKDIKIPRWQKILRSVRKSNSNPKI